MQSDTKKSLSSLEKDVGALHNEGVGMVENKRNPVRAGFTAATGVHTSAINKWGKIFKI